MQLYEYFVDLIIPYVILVSIWAFINDKAFNWRPFLFSKYVIQNSLQKGEKSWQFYVCYILWWIFFSLPFIGAIGCSIFVGLTTNLTKVSIIVAIVPVSLLILLLFFENFNHNGYKIGLSAKILLPISLLVIFSLNLTISVMEQEKKWRAIAYMLTWPPIIVMDLSICYSRMKIKPDAVEQMIESDVIQTQFVKDMAARKLSKWVDGTGKVSIILTIICVAVSAIFNYTFYGIFKDKETLGTATGSFILDVILFVLQWFVPNQRQSSALLFIAYILKNVNISLGPSYWLFGHSLYFAFFGTFFLVRFLSWLLIIVICKKKDGEEIVVQQDEGKKSKKAKAGKVTMTMDLFNRRLEKLTPEGRRPSTKEAVSSIVGLGLAITAVVLELKYVSIEEAPMIFGYRQSDIFITIIVLSAFFAMCFSALVCSFNNHGKLTIPMLATFISAFILIGFFFGFYDNLGFAGYIKGNLFMITFMILTCLLLLILVVGNKFSFAKDSPNFWSIIVVSILVTVDFICLITIPICLENSFLGLTTVLFIFTIVCFIVFVNYFNSPETAKYWMISLFVCFIFFCSTGASLWKYLCGYYENEKSVRFTIVALIAVVFVGLYAFAIMWTKAKLWRFTQGPMLVTFFTSLILLAGSGYIFYRVEKNIMAISFVCFLFTIITFGSLMLFSLQKHQWKKSFLTTLSAILLIVTTLAIVVYACYKKQEAFHIYSVISLITAAFCLITIFGYTLFNSKTQVLVFTNIFFPVRRYVNGTIKKITSFTVTYIAFVIIVWLWGLIGASLENSYYSCIFAMNGVWVLAIFLAADLLMNLDAKAISAVKCMSEEAANYAVEKAMKGARINSQLEMPTKNRATFDKFLKYEKGAYRMWGSRSLFLSSLKAQLYISGEMAFEQAKSRIRVFLTKRKKNTEFLDSAFFSIEERTTIIGLWKQLGGSTSLDNAKYDDFVAKQEQARSKALLSLLTKSSETKAKYEDLCKKLTCTYKDPDFHPQKAIKEFNKNILKDCKWVRCENVFKGPILGETEKDEIVQGSFGDCYLVASLNALSYDDAKDLLVNPEEGAKRGISCVRFKALGQDIYVIVDTQIPYKVKKPKMVSPKDLEKTPWWFVVVEKAYAKLFGSYSVVIGGTADVSLYRLIGGWPKSYIFDDLGVQEMISNGELWNNMVQWHEDGNYMCCGSNPGSDTEKNKEGIVQGHAYAVINVIETHGIQLISLRNPWGDSEWTGDWGDESPLWERYPAIAADCKFDKAKEDGMFWIAFKDFLLNYSSLYVCLKISDNFNKVEIHNKLLPGQTDGAKPIKNSPDADLLPQYSVRIPGGTTLKFTLERVSPDIPHWIYMLSNKGKPFKKIVAGSNYRSEAVPSNKCVHSFEWTVDESESEPWTLVVCRNKHREETKYMLTIWSDKKIEVAPLINADKAKIVQ